MSVPVVPDPGSRLDQLAARYDVAQASSGNAAETLKEIKDAIKAELASARPGERVIELRSPHLGKPLKLTAKTSKRVDTELLKSTFPQVYAYVVKDSTSWELR